MIAENDNFCATPRPRGEFSNGPGHGECPPVEPSVMPRAQDAAMIDRRTAAASIDTYYEANLLTGEASSPSLEELTRRGAQDQEDGRATLCALDISRCRDRMPGNRTGTCSTLHVRCARMRALIITPDHCIARARRCIRISCVSLCRFAFLNFVCAGDALLLLAFVVVARMVRDLFEALPLPRRRLSLHVLLVHSRAWQYAPAMLVQAHARGAPHVGRAGGAVQPPGLRLLGLSLELALRLVRRGLRRPLYPLRDGEGACGVWKARRGKSGWLV